MSALVIRELGELAPPPPPILKVRVVEDDDNKVNLKIGERTIATASPTTDARWIIGFSGWVVPSATLDGFFTTNRGEAIDALADIGKLYVAAKAGVLK